MNKLMFTFTVVLSLSCSKVDNQLGPSEQIAGFYKSTVYMVPGPTDGGVDIQAGGGFVELQLSTDSKMAGRIFIPQGVFHGNNGQDQNYAGTYFVSGDTVKFSIPEFFGMMKWIADQDLLETFDVPRRGRPYKIILQKAITKRNES